MPARFLTRFVLRLVSILAAVLLAASSGAAWAIVAIMLRNEAAWMALPAALAAVVGASGMVRAVRWQRALAAGLLCLLAAAIALYLQAGLLIAGGLGLDVFDVLATTGAEMAGALALARLSALEQAGIIACALLAAGMAWRQARPRAAP